LPGSENFIRFTIIKGSVSLKYRETDLSVMKKQILENIDNPEALEKLYRKDKSGFSMDFSEVSADKKSDLINFWQIRLQSGTVGPNHPFPIRDLGVISILSIAMAFLVKGHLFFSSMNFEEYWGRNLPMIIFSGLTAWFIFRGRVTGIKNILLLVFPVIILAVYLNLLPAKPSDTIILAFIHAPVFMWFIFGLAWVSFQYSGTMRLAAFIRFNGELVVMFGLLCIVGFMLSGMTIGLFAVIGKDIGQVYMENIGIVGLAVFPVLAAWLIDLYPDITSRIVPVIARIFTPFVFLLVLVYLVAITISGIDLSKNRDFLIIFNLLLLGVMIIIIFSLSELDKSANRKLNLIILFFLAGLTLIIDLFALTAIVSRLSDGFTPNRTVVLISNILILLHLLLILPGLFLAGFRGNSYDQVERIIYGYLPVYLFYSIVVIFVFPFIFGMNG
jgi:hypothetical protein